MAVEPGERVDLRRTLDAPPRVPFTYNKGLDGIRGVGIVFIAFCHYVAGVSIWGRTRFFGLSLSLDMFFALSGYLITALLLEEWSKSGRVSMRNFYIRRGLRLLPALYTMLAVVLVLAVFTDLIPTSTKLAVAEVVAAALYVYPLILFTRGEQAFLVHLWSLSVEEWFYFLWPTFLLIVGLRPGSTRRFRLAIWTLIGLCVLCFGIRLIPDTTGPWHIITALRPDAIAYGALLAFAARKLQDPHPLIIDRILGFLGPLGCVGLLYFCFAVYPRPAGLTEIEFHDVAFNSWNYQLGIWCAVLAVFHLVLRPEGRIARGFAIKPLPFIGILSYGLYLWHQPIFLVLNGPHFANGEPTRAGHNVLSVPQMWALGLGCAALSVVVALLSRRFIELPALRQKHRFESVHVSDRR